MGAILGDVTLLTALLFWFGFLYSGVFFGYFRVHLTVLNQSASDILARGADGLFKPPAGFALVVAAATLSMNPSLAQLVPGVPGLGWALGVLLLFFAWPPRPAESPAVQREKPQSGGRRRARDHLSRDRRRLSVPVRRPETAAPVR
ncbi:MAG TPA: hypothetical protein VG317_12040 [Pseudonocardiaceae bacterium]|nr:hypothetical protein [Pseudonocardiaceae bacterium]